MQARAERNVGGALAAGLERRRIRIRCGVVVCGGEQQADLIPAAEGVAFQRDIFVGVSREHMQRRVDA